MKVFRVILSCLVSGTIFLTDCNSIDNGYWEPLAGFPSYYVRTDYEGITIIGYSNSWFASPEVLLGGIDGFASVGSILVVQRTESKEYFLFDAKAKNMVSAQASFSGPLSRIEINQKAYQLSGDSTIHMSLIP